MKHLRRMTWALIGWTIASAGLLIAVIGSFDSYAACKDAYFSGPFYACESSYNAGRVGAVLLVVGAWFVGFVVLSLIWFMSKPKPAG